MAWRLKDGTVRPVGVQPQIWAAIALADQVWAAHGAPDLVVTSLVDGRHALTSLHYAGAAVDLRTRNLPSDVDKRAAVEDLGDRLGRHFDVLLEGLGRAHEHCHVEYQPRRP